MRHVLNRAEDWFEKMLDSKFAAKYECLIGPLTIALIAIMILISASMLMTAMDTFRF